MNFNCDNCNARYFIPDERVKGRRVTITCKRCSHKIHIRDGAVASQSGQVGAKHLANKPAIAVAPPPPAAASRPKREKPVWLVAINEVPVGPLPIEEIARKAKLGAVTLESLCWREGLEEWIPAAEVDEIREAIERALEPAGEASAEQAAPPPVARTSRPSLGSMPAAESQTESEAEPEGKLPGAWASRSEPSLRLGDDEVEDRSSLPFPPPSAPETPKTKTPSPADAPQKASQGASQDTPQEAGGALAGETPADAQAEAQTEASATALDGRPSLSLREGDRDPTPRPSRLSAAPDSPEQTSKPLFLRFALVGLLCGALGYFLGFWHGAQSDAGSIAAAPSSADDSEAGTTREGASTTRRPLSAQLRFDDSLAVEPEESASEEKEEASPASSMAAATKTTRLRPPSSSGSTASSAMAPSPAPSTEMRPLSAEEKRMLESFSNTGSAPKIGGVSAPSSQVRTTQAGSAPARQTGGLDSASISRVISQNQPSLQQCYERAVRGMPIAQSLRINVHVVIGGSGTVTRAQASGDSLPGLNTCIENAVKRWQFPSAPGGGETRFPVVFSGK